MIYYLIPLVIVLYAAIKYDLNNRKSHSQYVVWAFLFVYLTLLIGLRFEVGGDTLNYMGMWKWQKDLSAWKFSLKEYFAPGYSLLCSISYTISPNFYVFQLIHSLIFNTLLFVFLSRTTKYKYSALFFVFVLTYLYFSTEILREAIAVLIFAFNYTNLLKRRWIKYYIGVLFCLMFHFSAIILVFLPFVKWIKIDRNYIWCCIFIVIIGLSFSKFIGYFNDTSILADQASRYLGQTTHGKFADAMRLLRLFLFPLFLVILMKYGMHKDIRFENMLAIYILFGLASFFYPIIFARFANYFILFYAISFAEIVIDSIKIHRKSFRNNTLILLVSFMIIYGSDYIMYHKYIRWVPYYSIMNPKHIDRDNYN